MEQLIQQFMDRYLSREEIAYRLPVSIPISQFWPVMEEARKKSAISLPLKAQNGLPFDCHNKTIEAAMRRGSRRRTAGALYLTSCPSRPWKKQPLMKRFGPA